MSGPFFDSGGTKVLEINNNGCVGYTNNWDIEQDGPRTIIRRAKGDIALHLRFNLPNEIVVERLNMKYKGITLFSDHDTGGLKIGVEGSLPVNLTESEIELNGPLVIDPTGKVTVPMPLEMYTDEYKITLKLTLDLSRSSGFDVEGGDSLSSMK